MKKTILACACALFAVDRERVRTGSAGPRRIDRASRRQRRGQEHDQAYEHEKGNDDGSLYRQNEGRQLVQCAQQVNPSAWKRLPLHSDAGLPLGGR
jgi:hypothetical protein